MASPQKEDGYIPIANELAEAFARIQLSGYEIRVLWVILRKTYGWNRKYDGISITQFERATNIERRNIVRTLKRLQKKHLIVKNDNGFITKWGLQKNYERWQIKSNINLKRDKLLSKMTTKTIVNFDTHKRHI